MFDYCVLVTQGLEILVDRHRVMVLHCKYWYLGRTQFRSHWHRRHSEVVPAGMYQQGMTRKFVGALW